MKISVTCSTFTCLFFRSEQDSDISRRPGNVDANERKSLIHYHLLKYIIALPCTIRAWLALTTVRAFFQDGVATLAFLQPIVTQEVDEKQVQVVPSPFRKGRLRGILSLEIPLNPPFSKGEITKKGFFSTLLGGIGLPQYL